MPVDCWQDETSTFKFIEESLYESLADMLDNRISPPVEVLKISRYSQGRRVDGSSIEKNLAKTGITTSAGVVVRKVWFPIAKRHGGGADGSSLGVKKKTRFF